MLTTCAQIEELQANYAGQSHVRDLIPVLAIREVTGTTTVKLAWLDLGGEPIRYRRFLFFSFTRKELPTETLRRLRPILTHMGSKEKRELNDGARRLLDNLTAHEGRKEPDASNVHQLTPRIASA